MTSSGSINNQYHAFDGPNVYGLEQKSSNQSGGYNHTGEENLTYFQGYQGSGTDGYQNNSGIFGPEPQSFSGYSNTPPKQPLNDSTALARIQMIADHLDKQITGETNGEISLGDLREAAADDSGKYSKDDKEAIQYLLDNQNGMRGRLDNFDGKGDSLIKVDSINALVANPNAQPEKEKTPEEKMTNTEAIMTLKQFLDRPFVKGIDREGLIKMSEDEKIDPQLRIAAKKLLQNEELFKAADVGKKNDGKYDGFISVNDLKKLINRPDLDKIGANSGSYGAGGFNGQPVIQPGVNAYPPVYTGNSNLDYYYNNIFGTATGPASDAFRQAPGGGQQQAA